MMTGVLKISPMMLTTDGKLAAAPVASIRNGNVEKSYGSNAKPSLLGGELVLAFEVVPPRPTVFPKIPDAKILDQRTRNERNWLSRRHRGFALRSRNSLTLTPVSNLKIPFTWEKGNPSAWRNQKLNSLSSSLEVEFSSDENLRRQ